MTRYSLRVPVGHPLHDHCSWCLTIKLNLLRPCQVSQSCFGCQEHFGGVSWLAGPQLDGWMKNPGVTLLGPVPGLWSHHSLTRWVLSFLIYGTSGHSLSILLDGVVIPALDTHWRTCSIISVSYLLLQARKLELHVNQLNGSVFCLLRQNY